MRTILYAAILAATPLFATAAVPESAVAPAAQPPAQGASPSPSQNPSSNEDMRHKAGGIISQPARDVGLSRKAIPPVLVKAAEDPYSLTGLKSCKSLVATIEELTQTLGPDYGARPVVRENRSAKLAEAGGAAVVNSLIPFRGVVREVSGAAPAERSLNAAIDAGLARRGFLRGVYYKQGCKPRL